MPTGQIKDEHPKMAASENNQVYQLIMRLREGFAEKTIAGKPVSEEERNASHLTLYSYTTELGFGKFEGRVVGEIVREDPGYVLWCVQHLLHFCIDERFFTEPHVQTLTHHSEAREVNLVKIKVLDDADADEEHYDNCEDGINWAQESFNAVTDGQLGDWDEFEGGMNNVWAWAGKD